MPDIRFICPHCGGDLVVDSRGEGRSVPCPLCKQTILIPQSRRVQHPPTTANPPLPEQGVKKYALTGESKEHRGVTVHRIIRLRDGQVGGWIEKESNLSHEGNCWVYDEATVIEDAIICDDAQASVAADIHGKARISGHARVTGTACVYDRAHVCENAVVVDAYVGGNEVISGNNRINFNYFSNPLKAKTPKEALVAVGLNAWGVLSFSTARWLKKKYDERPR